ncbi:MAG: MMPL family transporter [Proteobacteria bacterium]|nr:MMPL family transporter [Pseudomonadota bacterium]
MFGKVYKAIITDYAKISITIICLVLAYFLYFSKDFKLDASSDSLLLESDKDLKYLREVNERYGSKDYLVLTYTPIASFIDEETIINLQFFKSKIEKLEWVDSVITIIDVPLLKNSNAPLMERLKNYKTLSYPEIDKKRGFNEIINSPIYKDYVISADGKTSGIVVYLKQDKKLNEFIKIKNNYFNLGLEGNLDESQKKERAIFNSEYDSYKSIYNQKNHQNINEIREVIKKYNVNAEVFLGGLPMITDDMMSFVQNDIVVFGIGVFIFIVITLWLIFKKIKWVVIPLLGCAFSVGAMIGMVGLLGWKVTVISSNFIAIMLILNMAMNIHITVRFLQIKKEFQGIDIKDAVYEASSKMFMPILYTVLTTICAFLSLIFSGIKPIIDFGWMMTLGLTISTIITLTLIPALLNEFSNPEDSIDQHEEKSKITSALSNFSKGNTSLIFGTTLIVIFLSIVGIFKLEVENSFINYFDKKTEIYKGMKKIDDQLGGTTPLDIILKFPVKEEKREKDDEFSEWDKDTKDKDETYKYWFTRDKIDKILKVHDYLESLPEIGKVISFGSIIRVAEDLIGNKLETLETGILYSKFPEEIKKEIISPYISIKDNEARISVRIKDSLEDLRRNELIKKINSELKTKVGLGEEEYKLSGVLILFNNLLQSLFKSQILSLGVTMIGILLMFLVLFRNLTLSLIGVVPNFIAAFFILGIIGLSGIPLDMMTITIAAITIGIAVDNSIHYIYRFKEEFEKIKNYNDTVSKCHNTIGISILNTTVTIIFGFSILFLSNFIPTIYFGVLTGVAMLFALISVLTLLPKLILVLKPFGNE